MTATAEPDLSAWPALGLAILTLSGRHTLVECITDGWAADTTLAGVTGRLNAVRHFIDEAPKLAPALADSYS